MTILDSAYISRKDGEISLRLFRNYLRNKSELSEAGEHHIFCGLTGEPILLSGHGIVYFVSKNCEPSYIEYQDTSLSIHNVEKLVAEEIAKDLNGDIHMVYMHG